MSADLPSLTIGIYLSSDGITTASGVECPMVVFGGPGDDAITTGSGADYIDGGLGADTINGAGGDDFIDGGDGADTLWGGDGEDELHGWPGNDTLHSGNDTLYGNYGFDILRGGDGHDLLYGGGGDGDDDLDGGPGEDTLQGGPRENPGVDDPLYIDEKIIDITGHHWGFYSGGYDGDNAVSTGEYREAYTWHATGASHRAYEEVFVRWVPGGDLGADVSYYVDHGGGQSETIVNQQGSPPGSVPDDPLAWQSLGVWDGVSDVRIIAPLSPSDPYERVCADAVLLRGVDPICDLLTDSNNDGQITAEDDPGENAEAGPGRIVAIGSSTRTEVKLHAAAVDAFLSEPQDWTAYLRFPSALKLWTAAVGGSELTTNTERNITTQGPWDTSVWVEGLTAGTAFLQLELHSRPGEPEEERSYVWYDSVKFTILDLTADIDVDSNNDGGIDSTDDPLEMTDPGKIVRYNDDDDNDNWTPDREEPGPVQYENDLVPIHLGFDAQGHYLRGYTFSLDQSASSPYLHLWASTRRDPLETTTFAVGVDPIPTLIYAEGYQPGVARLDWVLFAPEAGEVDRDSVKLTVVRVDLSVDNDLDITCATDGVRNYLPGYCGDIPVLSSGSSFNTATYQGQQMKLVAEGIGANQGVYAVRFQMEYTAYWGYAGNATDPNWEGPGSWGPHDYSLGSSGNSPEAMGTMVQGKTYVDFWAQDYGGKAEIDVTFWIVPGVSSFHYYLSVPYDRDDDGISDASERQKVQEWNTQFGASETVGTRFFAEGDDKELRDPDGRGPLPLHKHAGDSLTVFQEYRGFILDGGHGSFPGGHTRLSPAHKELPIESDMMEGVPHMPSVDDIKGVLNTVVSGFENATNGAGIWVYWVLDQTAATPHQEFANPDQRFAWASGSNRNDWLGQFVHLMFADKSTDRPSGGMSGTYGSYVFVVRKWDQSQQNGFDFQAGLARTAAHEITHLLLNERNTHGFDRGEHEHDPDPTDPPESPLDLRYLMYFDLTSANWTTIVFSNHTRQYLDLTSKQSVER